MISITGSARSRNVLKAMEIYRFEITACTTALPTGDLKGSLHLILRLFLDIFLGTSLDLFLDLFLFPSQGIPLIGFE